MAAEIFIGAFAYGLIHALDPDHLATVSAINSSENRVRKAALNACAWSLGHGLSLLLFVFLLSYLGMLAPEVIYSCAEFAVGVLLILIGFQIIQSLYPFVRLKTLMRRIISQMPDSLSISRGSKNNFRKYPFYIGLLHGFAGSAGLLSLVHIYGAFDLYQYVVVLSLGCLLGMLAFVLSLRYLELGLVSLGFLTNRRLRLLIGCVAVCIGTMWIINSIQ